MNEQEYLTLNLIINKIMKSPPPPEFYIFNNRDSEIIISKSQYISKLNFESTKHNNYVIQMSKVWYRRPFKLCEIVWATITSWVIKL